LRVLGSLGTLSGSVSLQPYTVYRIIDVHDLTQGNLNRLTKKDPVVNMENKWWDSDTLAVVTGGKPPSCLV